MPTPKRSARALRAQLRHPYELRMVVIGIALSLTVYALAISVFMLPDDQLTLLGNLPETFALVLFFPIVLVFLREMKRARGRASNIAITPTQYPDLYQIVVEAARDAGLTTTPPAYLTSDPSVEACKLDNGMKQSVTIGTDFLAGCRENNDPDALRFMVAHQLGHVAARHGSFGRMLATSVLTATPGLSGLLTRAQEYTADNYGHHFHAAGGHRAIALTATGKDNFIYVSESTQLWRAETQRGLSLWLTNLLTSHPMPAWRTHALAHRDRPGRIIGWPTVYGAVPEKIDETATGSEVPAQQHIG